MENQMTAMELARRCRQLAEEHKTLYVMGCFGAPMTAKNRKRYSDNYAYNRLADRMSKINAADENTFGVAGEKTLNALSGKNMEMVIFKKAK